MQRDHPIWNGIPSFSQLYVGIADV